MSKYKTTIGENKYGKYCLPVLNKERQEVTRILENSVHEADTIEFAISYAPGDIVHGGTFFGDMLPVFSKHFDHVWAFEPNDYSHYCASQTIQLNNLDNITLANAGISNKNGQAHLTTKDRYGKDAGSASRISLPSSSTIAIDIVAIDNVVPEDANVSVIHLDVEGQELYALQGALQTIKRCRPAIILETKNNSIQPYKKLLAPHGYSCTGRTHSTPFCPVGVNTLWEIK